MKVNVLERAKAALESLNAEELVSLYTGEFVFEDVPGEERITSRDELMSYFQRLFSLPGVGFSEVVIRDCSDWAVIEWTWSGDKVEADERYHIKGVSIVHLRDGKMASETLYYDPRQAL